MKTIFTFILLTFSLLSAAQTHRTGDVYNPSEVELVLSQMTLSELLVAEGRGSKLKSPLLRRQFANMVTRCMQNICTDNCMLAC